MEPISDVREPGAESRRIVHERQSRRGLVTILRTDPIYNIKSPGNIFDWYGKKTNYERF